MKAPEALPEARRSDFFYSTTTNQDEARAERH